MKLFLIVRYYESHPQAFTFMNTFIHQSDRDRQRNTDIRKRYKLGKHIVVELAQQITKSFMQWNKNSPHAIITTKIINDQNTSCS